MTHHEPSMPGSARGFDFVAAFAEDVALVLPLIFDPPLVVSFSTVELGKCFVWQLAIISPVEVATGTKIRSKWVPGI